jgi:hypothetical protein
MSILDQLRRLGAAVAFAECGEFVTAVELAYPPRHSCRDLSSFLSEIGLDNCKVRLLSIPA